MRKILFLMLSMAFVFTACEDKDATLAKGLVGTWYGTGYVDENETEMGYQFFEGSEPKTGKFVEITDYRLLMEDFDSEFEIPYTAYAGGTYTVKDGSLILTYDTETTSIILDKEAVNEYVTLLQQQDAETGDGFWANEDAEKIAIYFTDTREEDLTKLWTELLDDMNNSEGSGFGDLKVDDKKMSFDTEDVGTLSYERVEKNIFEEYPFDE